MVDSKKKYNVGVVGFGFLGQSMVHQLSLHANIKIYDRFKDFDTIEDTVTSSDLIFMCLPTPMKLSNGECDMSILDGAVSSVNALCKPEEEKVVIIKSTVSPGAVDGLQAKYQNICFVSCPEFLTQRSHLLDSLTASRIVLGGNEKYVNRVEELYRYRFGNSTNIYKCSHDESSLVKLGANIFFAVKISYFNFLYEMCEKTGADFSAVRDMVLADGRIAKSHADVPGWDGLKMFGGACFVKDINAFIHAAKRIGVNPELLEAAWSQNLRLRPEKDWEQIPSAITNDRDKK